MRAKFINEFERGLDPKAALGVGIYKILNDIDDSNFPIIMTYGKHKDDYLLYEFLGIDLDVNDLTEEEKKYYIRYKNQMGYYCSLY